jgi:photosystem II stability/assembly factor-like uncharacterized protein
MKKTLVRTIACVLGLACSQTHGQWVPTSGPGGGWITSIAVGTSDMFAGAWSGGVFRSTDNGVGWISVSNNLRTLMVKMVLYDGSTIFAATTDSGIYRSTNSGGSWTAVNSGLANRATNTLMRSSTALYAGLGGSGNGGYVYRSSNNGDSWSVVNGFLWPTTPVSCIAQVDTHLFAGTNGAGVWHAGNGTWQGVNTNLGSMSVSALAVSGNNLFAGTAAGIYRSTNLGATWAAANGGLTIYGVKYLVTSGSTIYAGTPSGLLQSTNDGANWTTIHPHTYSLAIRGTTLFAGTTVGVSISDNLGATWNEYSTGLTTGYISPILTLGNRLFVGDAYYEGGTGVYRSTDHGTSWDSVNTGLPPFFLVSALANIDTTLFCTDRSEGVYRSTDYGGHWTASDVGLGLGRRPSAFAVQDTQLFAASQNMVFVSTDRGESWDLRSNFGLPGGPVSSLVFNGNNLFAGHTGFSDQGIYLSTDAGVNWSAANVGLAPGDARYINSLAANGTTLFAGTAGGMFRSTDNGASWQASTGLPAGGIFAVIAPGSTILAGTLQGVYVSTDNGTTWARTDTRRMIIMSLARDGTDLYAGLSGGGVWRQSSPDNVPVAFSASPANAPGLLECRAPGQSPAINVNITSLTGSGIIAVSRYVSPPVAPGFAGTPPAHFSSYRWVITQSGLSSFSAEVRFRLAGLNLGILNPSGVTVYRRATPGSGSFSPLSTTYDAANNELRAPVTSFSEFIFGSNTDPLTGVQAQQTKPAEFMLEQNYPNPFNPATLIRYSVGGGNNQESGAGRVKLVVYDLLGRQVAELVNEEKPAGSYTIMWNANGMPSGVYFYQLRVRDRVDTRRMILLR